MKIDIDVITKQVEAKKRREEKKAAREMAIQVEVAAKEERITLRKHMGAARLWVKHMIRREIIEYVKDGKTGPMRLYDRTLTNDYSIHLPAVLKAIREVEDVTLEARFVPEERCDCGGDGCQINHGARYDYYLTWPNQPPYRDLRRF